MPLDAQTFNGPPGGGWRGEFDDPAQMPGATIVETTEDGGVTVREVPEKEKPPSRGGNFDENLAEREELKTALSEIAQELLDGIEADIRSRSGFIDNFVRNIDLLGLIVDDAARTKGQRTKTNPARDQTLLESVVKAQSQARGELLPAVGPVKVATVAEATADEEQLAADFEKDMNQVLTVGMPEYVPDLDRGLFGFFFGGNMFRYGYIDPMKGRPSVATVGVEDLIVSQEATDLQTCLRWTMKTLVPPGEAKRKQYYGIWRECELGTPMPVTGTVDQKKAEVAGLSSQPARPKDMPYEFYHTVCDWDFAPYGLKEKGAPDKLPLPYRITVEKHSRQIVRIERFWKDGDKRFARKRRCIHYGMVPGFGFLAYGFLHLQGNQVAILTGIIRLLIDAMKFASFPGGVKIKGQRSETNQIEPGPGEFAELGVPAGIDDIKKVIMPLPYKDLSPVSIQLYELVQQACARVGAASMLETGEGRAQMPVGTIMAMLEEKSVVMSAVHKRLHEAMAQELRMIRELFLECPEALEEVLESPTRKWGAEQEFGNLDLVPASDPNIPSQVHRVMLATALATLATLPGVSARLDIDDLLKRVLRGIGISDVGSLVLAQPTSQPDPGAAQAQATLQAKQMDLQAKEQEQQRKAASDVVKAQQQEKDSQRDAAVQQAKIESDQRVALIKEDTERVRLAAEERRSQRDHIADREDAALGQQNAAADREQRGQLGMQRSFGGQGL
jgi:hypothetical protein